MEQPSWPADARRDRIIGDWSIYQRTGGHRTSTDDLICAWYAVHRTSDRPGRYLDLGCGIGSVLLMVAHRLRPPICHGVEAQAQSVMMARRTIDELPAIEAQLDVELGDFRDVDFDRPFDLVTGSPPYFPLESGVLPADPQRLACRFEKRGGVEDYASAAARALAPDGRFYLVFQTVGEGRVLDAAGAAGLHLSGRADFRMRRDRRDPFLSVFELALSPASQPLHRFECAVRDADGAITSDYQAVRDDLGL